MPDMPLRHAQVLRCASSLASSSLKFTNGGQRISVNLQWRDFYFDEAVIFTGGDTFWSHPQPC